MDKKLIFVFLILFNLSLIVSSTLISIQNDKNDHSSSSNAFVTVSGISSGGFMAVQFHVAFSSIIKGAGIIAGGPYYCAKGNLEVALTSCMKTPEFISISELISATSSAQSNSYIDNTDNLASSKVWIFSGTQDTVVDPGVVQKLQQYYQNYIKDDSQISTTYNVPAEHSFITNSYGNACNYLGPDYINNCQINGAFEILSFLHGPLNHTSSNVTSNIVQINQASYIPNGGSPSTASLNQYAYAYIPSACKTNKGLCSFHIAFHGCEQTISQIGSTFYTKTGYNEIAEANNIIVLYPQAAESLPYNQGGCFDWYGITGSDYAYNSGIQMATVKNMLDYLISTY